MTTRANKRPNRVPVSGQRDILTVENKDESNIYYWTNDVDDRIQRFVDGGYSFVTADGKLVGTRQVDSTGKSIGSIVSKNVGLGVTAYLMAISREWYEEDQKAKQDSITAVEESMRNSGQDGNYGDVKISKL